MSVRHVGYQHPLSAAINTTYPPFKSFISTHQSLPLTAVVGSLTLEVRASKTSPQWFVRPWISVIVTSKYRRLPTWDINKFIFYCSLRCEIGFYVHFSFYTFHSVYIFIYYCLFFLLYFLYRREYIFFFFLYSGSFLWLDFPILFFLTFSPLIYHLTRFLDVYFLIFYKESFFMNIYFSASNIFICSLSL